ncbi:MAG: beta-lactamase class D [Saprospiraceae bacterium]|jgi:beta-lactamase class D
MKPKNISQLFALLSCLSILYSCQQEKAASEQQKIEEQEVVKSNEIVMETFQMIVDSNQVSGSILIYDSKNDTYYSNDFERAATEFLPASTFKVTNSMIGLETGVLKDSNHLFKWDGEPRRLKNWEADLTLAEAYKVSCVPCYQEVARTIGTERMNEYLKKLDYGNMEIADSMIDIFWLEGEFKISQKQQIDFLKRFYNKELPISDRTFDIMRKLMVLDENENYTLSGKTGWAILNDNNIGWFIGFVEKGDNVYYMATNVTSLNQNETGNFAQVRLQIGLEALESLNKE